MARNCDSTPVTSSLSPGTRSPASDHTGRCSHSSRPLEGARHGNSHRGDEGCRCAAAALLRHRSLPTASPKPPPKGSITVLSDDELGLADLASARKYPQNPPLSQGGDSKVNIRHQGHDRQIQAHT